jgi:hypothetical protein
MECPNCGEPLEFDLDGVLGESAGDDSDSKEGEDGCLKF